MSPRQKVLALEAQIRAMIAGEQKDFTCPFCQLTTTEGEGVLCCNEAADVVNAILDHVEHLERCVTVEQVMDRFHSAPSPLFDHLMN